MDERQLLEHAAGMHFIESYNARQRTRFQIIEHRDKPDFLLKDIETEEILGLEVMHLYYDGTEARMMLGRQANTLHGVMTITELIAKLNNDLVEKVAKASKYRFDSRVFLVIRVVSPIFDLADFEIYGDEILIPKPNLFDEIWLLLRNNSTNTFSDLKQIQ